MQPAQMGMNSRNPDHRCSERSVSVPTIRRGGAGRCPLHDPAPVQIPPPTPILLAQPHHTLVYGRATREMLCERLPHTGHVIGVDDALPGADTRHHLIGSVAEHVVRHSAVPVLSDLIQ